MSFKLILSVGLLFAMTNCKNVSKVTEETTPDVKEQSSSTENNTLQSPPLFIGTWRQKTATEESEVMLLETNDSINGTLIYKEFDGNGDMTSYTGLLSLLGMVKNDTLMVDIYDPKGRKASTAKLFQDGPKLTFVLTGQKINYPDTFTAIEVD